MHHALGNLLAGDWGKATGRTARARSGSKKQREVGLAVLSDRRRLTQSMRDKPKAFSAKV